MLDVLYILGFVILGLGAIIGVITEIIDVM